MVASAGSVARIMAFNSASPGPGSAGSQLTMGWCAVSKCGFTALSLLLRTSCRLNQDLTVSDVEVHVSTLEAASSTTWNEAFEHRIGADQFNLATIIADEVARLGDPSGPALVDAILGGWQRDRPNFPNYASGSWGPKAADNSHLSLRFH